MRLADWVRDKDSIWAAIVRHHGLVESRLADVADWAFADFHWAQRYDVWSSMEKLHAAGFAETIDSGQMLRDHLSCYRAAKILP